MYITLSNDGFRMYVVPFVYTRYMKVRGNRTRRLQHNANVKFVDFGIARSRGVKRSSSSRLSGVYIASLPERTAAKLSIRASVGGCDIYRCSDRDIKISSSNQTSGSSD